MFICRYCWSGSDEHDKESPGGNQSNPHLRLLGRHTEEEYPKRANRDDL